MGGRVGSGAVARPASKTDLSDLARVKETGHGPSTRGITLRDDAGSEFDLFWLRDAALEDVFARLGPPAGETVDDVQGVKFQRRDWWIWSGAVIVTRANVVGQEGKPVVGLTVPGGGIVFTLDFAFRTAGLNRNEAPDPDCSPEGEVTFPHWRGVGMVRVNYVVRTLMISPFGGGGEGGRKKDAAAVFDLTERLMWVA